MNKANFHREDECLSAECKEDAELDKLRQHLSNQAHELTGLRRSKQSLLKMVAGMAVGGYAYKAGHSKIAQEVADDLDRAGVKLDVDTIRKWLREAAEELPAES